jgi:hypothetical protein
MPEINLTHGQKLYAEARQIIIEQLQLKERSERNYVRLATILAHLYARISVFDLHL